MIYNFVFSIQSTSSYARIYTTLIATSLVQPAFCANGTLGAASGWGTHHTGRARTNSLSVYLTALTVWPARRRVTWIYIYRFCKIKVIHYMYISTRTSDFLILLPKHTGKRSTFYESITRCTFRAATHRNVINYVTNRSACASSWTRICTFIFNTCFVVFAVRALHTLGATTIVWISMKFWNTTTFAIVTFCISPTR